MRIIHEGHDFGYEMGRLAMAFFPGRPVGEREDGDGRLTTRLRPEGEDLSLAVRLEETGRPPRALERILPGGALLPANEQERELGLLLYDFLSGQTGLSLPWGILTGVRPIKLFHRAAAQGMDDAVMADHFSRRYRLSPERIALGCQVRRREARLIDRCDRQGFSLYISIPFCPGRCSYCSFVSHSVAQAQRLIAPYVDCLVRELEILGRLAGELRMRPQTVYWGGGTPTTLSAGQLEAVLRAVERNFDLSAVEEYTVEAGRPDTIDRARLLALRAGGVSRLSINPQTLNNEVLARVGRAHSAGDVEAAFSLARSLGFGNVNMDLIAGLPGEEAESFCRSVEGVLAMGPESVTIHTLAVKRAADLAAMGPELLRDARAAAQMVDYGRRRLIESGLFPYYLYRQKNMLADLENVGYAKPGCESLYNVYIMDETHSILSAGAGGVTKLRRPGGAAIRRIFNYKYPYEYIDRFALLMARKEGVREFYENGDALSEFSQ